MSKAPWFYEYDGMDGSFMFNREPQEKVYGKEYGPFKTFREAKRDLINRINGDIRELKLTLSNAREARATDGD